MSALAEESLAAARDWLYVTGTPWRAGRSSAGLGGRRGPGASEQAEAFGTKGGRLVSLGDTGGQADVLFMLGTFGL